MQLNFDCVRDLLLVLEDKIEGKPLFLNDVLKSEELRFYTREEIIYTSQKLKEQGFVSYSSYSADNEIQDISYEHITFNGHQYLDSVRDPKVWNGVKKVLADKGLTATFNSIGSMAIKLLLG